jgi:hypothetical protein
MSLVQYTISNNSSVGKTFTYNSASIAYEIFVPGFSSSIFIGDDTPTPTLLITGSMVSEDTFVSDAYIPPSGSAWLWSNGNKVQYIKISNTPTTGSNISSIINRAEWIEFSMVGAKNKEGNFLYPTSPTSARVERYVINNANDIGTYNSIIINDSSTETSTAVSADTTNSQTGFSYIDTQFSIDQDCDPILNNATEPRTNEWLQDVDYSVNAITPINFDQLINFTATKATVPQSNYTQLGIINSKYVGSSTTRDKINEYNPLGNSDPLNKLIYSTGIDAFLTNKGKGPSLGKIPNVELNNAYVAYFNKIIDPYPILNNKVAYYVKFLVDDAGNILDPILSDINFSVFKDTFQLKDYDDKPTRVNTAISNIDESKELLQLNEGLASVFKMGQYPVPILYTQTSSLGHADEISLSGSNFYSALGLNSEGQTKDFIKLGINIFSTQTPSPIPPAKDNPVNYSSTDVTWNPSTSITPLKSNTSPTIPTSSVYPSYAILFPIDDSDSPQGPGAGNILSDNYFIRGELSFPTSTMPAFYLGSTNASTPGYTESYRKSSDRSNTKRFTFNLKPYIKPPGSDDLRASYINSREGFEIESVKLKITENPGGSNEKVWDSLTIESVADGYGTQWALSPTGLILTPDSLYLEKIIIENLFKGPVSNQDLRIKALPLIAGGWAGNPVVGYNGTAVKYDWSINFKINGVRQGTGVFLEYSGTLAGQPGDTTLFGKPKDTLLHFGASGEPRQQIQWRRTFNPSFNTIGPTQPIIKYTVSSPLSENAVLNSATGPFWRRYPIGGNPTNALTNDMLYMSSSLLNQTYDIPNSPYYQAKLGYKGDRSTDFPLTIEPGFIEFDPVTDPWKLEIGDEIRFENNEALTFKITSIDDLAEKDTDSEDINDKLRVTISPPFTYINKKGESVVNIPNNFDFFVVRRYKDNKNFIILDQKMPYGFSYGNGTIDYSGEDVQAGVEPVTRSSSPGILLPEHRIEVFNKNPDLILKDLIEKGIVT